MKDIKKGSLVVFSQPNDLETKMLSDYDDEFKKDFENYLEYNHDVHHSFNRGLIYTTCGDIDNKGNKYNCPYPYGFNYENRDDLCASIQYTIVDILIKKLIKASKELGINEIAIAGGVSANSYLRERLLELKKRYNKEVYIPKFEYCTDNAAMIAISGYYKLLNGDFADQSVTPMSRLYF